MSKDYIQLVREMFELDDDTYVSLVEVSEALVKMMRADNVDCYAEFIKLVETMNFRENDDA